jgi:ketosteroid isomerase-like protein
VRPACGRPESPGTSYTRRISGDVGTQLIAAIAAQDGAALAACFAPDAQFRALIPPGLRERTGADDTAALIRSWFADSTALELIDSDAEPIGDRLHVSYRVEGVEDGEPYVVEQHLYCTVAGGKIARADLLCSGFRPRPD